MESYKGRKTPSGRRDHAAVACFSPLLLFACNRVAELCGCVRCDWVDRCMCSAVGIVWTLTMICGCSTPSKPPQLITICDTHVLKSAPVLFAAAGRGVW